MPADKKLPPAMLLILGHRGNSPCRVWTDNFIRQMDDWGHPPPANLVCAKAQILAILIGRPQAEASLSLFVFPMKAMSIMAYGFITPPPIHHSKFIGMYGSVGLNA